MNFIKSSIQTEEAPIDLCKEENQERAIILSSFQVEDKGFSFNTILGILRFFLIIYLFLPFFLSGMISFFKTEAVRTDSDTIKEINLYGHLK